jgi:cytochrome c-type biogenesis protein CcmH
MKALRVVLGGCLLAAALSLCAKEAAPEAADPALEARMVKITSELRCLVCQNQTIADSSAPLALDLRNQIRAQISQGRSDDQIRDYMVQRYGDFVLYKPPFKATTALLWVGPFALCALGIGLFVAIVRKRRRADRPETAALPETRRAEIERLLDSEP